MKLNDNFILHESHGKIILAGIGDGKNKFHGIVNLNKTGGVVVSQLSQGKSIDEVSDFLVNKYNVDKKRVDEGIEKLLAKLSEINVFDD